MQPEGRIVLTAADDQRAAFECRRHARSRRRSIRRRASRCASRRRSPAAPRSTGSTPRPCWRSPIPDDRDGDGISGRARMVEADGDARCSAATAGRRRAPTSSEQIADAFAIDLGLSSARRPLPHGDCTAGGARLPRRARAARARAFGGHELSDGDDRRSSPPTCTSLPAPTRAGERRSPGASSSPRPAAPPATCPRCRRPTAARSTAYTDLLLHDMGQALDDGVGEPGVASAEWRTAPLIGDVRQATGRRYLHDGRAPTLDAAIRAHGGEAEAARTRYRRARAMPSGRRSSPSWRASDAALASRSSSRPAPSAPRPAQTHERGRNADRADRDGSGLCRASSSRPSTDYIVPAYAALRRGDRRAVVGGRRLLRDARRRDMPTRCREPPSPRRVHAWAGVDFFRFGPMAQDGRYERFAFFPDVHGTGARQIRGFLVSQDEKLLEARRARRARARRCRACRRSNRCSIPAKRALLQPAPPEPFRCALAVAVADEPATTIADGRARRLAAATRAGRRCIEKPGPDNPVYRTHAEAMTEILKAILTGLEQDARPSARAGARQDAGGRRRRAARPTTPRARRSPISPPRRMRCSVSCEASGLLDLLPRSAGELRQLRRLRVLQPRSARSRRPGPTSKRRSPIRSSAQSCLCGDRAAEPARPLPAAGRRVGRTVAGLQFARRRLSMIVDRRSLLAGAGAALAAGLAPRRGRACDERGADPRAGDAARTAASPS